MGKSRAVWPTEQLMVACLLRHFRRRGYIAVEQVRMATGYAVSQRTIDVVCIHPYPSKGCHAIGIEVKISRTDFNKELRQPKKRARARGLFNQFYLAVPESLNQGLRIPDDCGLITVAEVGKATIAHPSPEFATLPDWPFVASLARKLQGERPNG